MTHIKFMCNRGTSNHHDWSSGKRVTVHGPKLRYVRLDSVHKPSTGHRFIWYWPSGACIYFDLYFDRRPRFEGIPINPGDLEKLKQRARQEQGMEKP